jgi:putative oxidoreductase
MKIFNIIGRVIFAIPFAVFGINHFINSDSLAGLYNTFIPLLPFTNFIVGVALLAAAVSIILNRYVRLSCLLLAALLFIFIITIHVPQLFYNYAPEVLKNDFGKMLIITNLLKDVALMGASIIIASLTNEGKVELNKAE